MAVEARYVGKASADYDRRQITLNAAAEPGDVIMADGKAAVVLGSYDFASGDECEVAISGTWEVTLTDNISAVKGVKLYWDESANTATYQVGAAGDFYLGVAAETVTGGTSISCKVELNAKAEYVSSLHTPAHNEPTVTETLGLGITMQPGGSFRPQFDAVAEAATAAVLLGDGVPVTDKWLFEARFVIVDDGDDAALDFNIGMANAGHATDADSITESIFIHTDGNVLNLLAESDDGTTEVAAVDTTIDYALGTPVTVWMDASDNSDVQIYIDGALILSGTTFDLSAATGPLFPLFHLEKSSNDTTADVICLQMGVQRIDTAGTS